IRFASAGLEILRERISLAGTIRAFPGKSIPLSFAVTTSTNPSVMAARFWSPPITWKGSTAILLWAGIAGPLEGNQRRPRYAATANRGAAATATSTDRREL